MKGRFEYALPVVTPMEKEALSMFTAECTNAGVYVAGQQHIRRSMER